MIMNVIFDLDGTLADISHRVHLVRDRDNQDWKEFYARVDRDVPIMPVIVTLRALYDCGHRIFIWSAREETTRSDTRHWLDRYDVPYDDLRLRPSGDYRKDTELKQEWLMDFMTRFADVIDLVFDDRRRVLEMFASHGVTGVMVGDDETDSVQEMHGNRQ